MGLSFLCRKPSSVPTSSALAYRGGQGCGTLSDLSLLNFLTDVHDNNLIGKLPDYAQVVVSS